jgi:hypothetical protein
VQIADALRDAGWDVLEASSGERNDNGIIDSSRFGPSTSEQHRSRTADK